MMIQSPRSSHKSTLAAICQQIGPKRLCSHKPGGSAVLCTVVFSVIILLATVLSYVDRAGMRQQLWRLRSSHILCPVLEAGEQTRKLTSTRFQGRVSVLINARYRSGSSLTGEMFIQHSGFAYYFEPLYYVIDQDHGYNGSLIHASQILNKLHNCSLTSKDMNPRNDHEFWTNVFLCGFNEGEQCNNGYNASIQTVPWEHKFQALCRSRPHQATKIIRVANFSTIMPFLGQGVKVIQLIRDPRGMYHSRVRMGHQPLDTVEGDCDTTIKQLNYLRHAFKHNKDNIKKSVYYLRYEDLATRPVLTMINVFKFLDVAPDVNTIKWAQGLEKKNILGEVIGKKRIQGNDEYYKTKMTTDREHPEFTANIWRLRLNMTIINRIQTACKAVHTEFGYTLFNIKQEVENLSIPSMKNMKDLFHDY